jgi:hypothetical protein
VIILLTAHKGRCKLFVGIRCDSCDRESHAIHHVSRDPTDLAHMNRLS